jgi:hypothetical protein
MGVSQRQLINVVVLFDIVQRSPCSSSHLLARWFLVRLIFDPEDGGDTFLQNVNSYTD